MKKFQFTAITPEGQRQSSTLEVNSVEQAEAILKERGLTIINLEPKKELSVLSPLSFLFGIPQREKIVFTRQLSTMISSGLPITSALQVLQAQTRNDKFKKVLGDIVIQIDSGNSLSKALEKHPQVFNRLYLSLIKAGEASGQLGEILNRLADNMEADGEFKSKTQGALIYPAVIVVVMLGVLALMVVFVIPKLKGLYEEIGAELPVTTKFLLNLSSFATSFWWLVLILLVLAAFLFRRAIQTEQGRYLYDDIKFRFPVLGRLFKETQLTSFTRTLSLLVKSGIPILQALEISSETLSSIRSRETIARSISQVEKGKSLATTLQDEKQFPPILPEMVMVGEETGKLDEVLEKLAAYFENEANNLTRNLSTALEPIIMVFLGVVVGFLVISLILPIYSLISQF